MKVLPEGWNEKRLDQWGGIVSGSTPSTTVPDFWDGDIVWVTPADLSKLSTPYLFDSAKRLTTAGLSSCSARLMPVGTVVLSSRAPIGYVALPRIPFCTNQGCKSLVLNEGVDPDFAYYSLIFNVDELKNRGEGTTFAEISKAALATVSLPLPTDTREQAKIGEILAATDRTIEQTEALLAKKERIKSGLMRDLLTRGVDENGSLRSDGDHAFKNSPFGRVPDAWDVDVFEQITPRGAPIGYGIVQPGAFDHGGVPVAGIYTINSDFKRWHMSSRSIEQAYRRSRIQSGDVLLSVKGTTGRVGVVPQGMTGNISREVARIRPDKRLNPYFLRFLMLSDVFQKYLALAEVGTTRAEISIKILRQLSVPIPPRSEQDEIVRRLQAIESDLDHLRSQGSKLKALKLGLMQDLLTGRKRVTPLLKAEHQPTEQVA